LTKNPHPLPACTGSVMAATKIGGWIFNSLVGGQTGFMKLGNVFLRATSQGTALAQPAIRASNIFEHTMFYAGQVGGNGRAHSKSRSATRPTRN